MEQHYNLIVYPIDYTFSHTKTIHSRPLLSWVIPPWYQSGLIRRIMAIGPVEWKLSAGIRYVDNHVIIRDLRKLPSAKEVMGSDFSAGWDHGLFITHHLALGLTEQVFSMMGSIIEQDASDAICFYPGPSEAGHRVFAWFIGNRQLYREIAIKEFSTSLFTMDSENPLIRMAKQGQFTIKFHEISPSLAICIRNQRDLNELQQVLAHPQQIKFNKIRVILNPHAGRPMPFEKQIRALLGIPYRAFVPQTNAEDRSRVIVDQFKKFGMDVEVTITKYPGHGRKIAAECADNDYDLVIAAGGDGTINEVVNGIAGTDVALGVIPLGSVNLFSLEHRIPMEIEAACEVISFGNIRTMDLGKVNHRYFVSVAGIGFDAEITRNSEGKLKKWMGSVSHGIMTVRQWLKFSSNPIEANLDGHPISHDIDMIIVANSGYYLGNKKITLHAQMDDGMLDAVVFQQLNRRRLMQSLILLWTGQIDEAPWIRQVPCRWLRIDSHHPIHVDAEFIGHTPATISIASNKLRIVV